MNDMNDQLKDVIDRLEKRIAEYTQDVEQNQRMLCGMLLWLMNKHHYRTLDIPLQALNEITDYKDLNVNFNGESVEIAAMIKAQTFDEFALPHHAQAIDSNVV